MGTTRIAPLLPSTSDVGGIRRIAILNRGEAATRALRAIRELRASPDRLLAMGERARAAFEREWDEPIALRRWREVIEEVEKVGVA